MSPRARQRGWPPRPGRAGVGAVNLCPPATGRLLHRPTHDAVGDDRLVSARRVVGLGPCNVFGRTTRLSFLGWVITSDVMTMSKRQCGQIGP
jgi:hypothetical protein